MKYVRIALTLVLAFVLCSAFTMKDKKEKAKEVYAFGVAASFTDTVVYYTPIQLLDSVHLTKNNFLPRREMYSYQMKNYLEYTLKKANYTCMIYFSENKNKLEKEAAKLMNKYKKQGGLLLQPIKQEEFSFKKPEE